ncbi:N-acetyltransferase [Kushneria pakistanensis]|uniref:N-acetyltransferase n=1 Tax=Kushneria pakistanensis TaxID=1508770 RepID=A0ABQ3FJB3_9GAMM|nr:GNAT family N-acetyltransferase [Kushneria pakistanensis]GHC25767.1 N-acetyltransferase [Kushneria pakistanensis]
MGEQTIWYLEMRDPSEHHARALPAALNVVECELPRFAFNRFLYELVGAQWQWSEKLEGDQGAWQAMVESDAHRTFVAYYRGAIAGYYELYRPDGVNVEILYFGLVAECIGQGFGAGLLSHAIEQAWGWAGTERVWLHTCSLDHPAALANYQKRGFKHYDEEIAPC